MKSVRVKRHSFLSGCVEHRLEVKPQALIKAPSLLHNGLRDKREANFTSTCCSCGLGQIAVVIKEAPTPRLGWKNDIFVVQHFDSIRSCGASYRGHVLAMFTAPR